MKQYTVTPKGLAIFTLLMFGGCWAMTNSYTASTREAARAFAAKTPDELAELYGPIGCRPLVIAQLKAPSTAVFAGSFSTWRNDGKTKEYPKARWPYETFIQVDAQNSFGAMIRTAGSCYHNGRSDFIGTVHLYGN